MPEQPFLVLPKPVLATRAKLGGGGGRFTKPTAQQQRQRLEGRFQEIANSLREVQVAVAGIELEQVIILETITVSVEQVAKAAAKIPGLEWLAERDLDDVDPDFGFQDEENPAAKLPVRLYALFTNQQAMDSLIGLWQRWNQEPDRRAATGYGPFKNLFIYLRDIRRWSPTDRIEATGVLERWREEIAVKGAQGTIPFEIELWFRSDAAKRQEAYAEVDALITAAGGRCLDTAAIAEISYHGILAELPGRVIEQTVNSIQAQNYTQLLRSEGVMFFRPQAQSRFSLVQGQQVNFDFQTRLNGKANAEGSPIVAVLDGLPLQNHQALQGRLIIDDPENLSERYNAGEQHQSSRIRSTFAPFFIQTTYCAGNKFLQRGFLLIWFTAP
jgi:hypothetical protein